jgi:predicted regulator of Ras-like GTPase activity (Roadblock/LC7/MglB family)
MTEGLSQALRALRDVDGVIGSFVIRADGSPRALDLPQFFDAELLPELGPRLARLREAWDGFGTEPDTTTLAFAALKLHVRQLDHGYLGVLSTTDVNTTALRMALALVARRVSLEPSASVRLPVPDAAPPAASKRGFFGLRR